MGKRTVPKERIGSSRGVKNIRARQTVWTRLLELGSKCKQAELKYALRLASLMSSSSNVRWSLVNAYLTCKLS
jgi:hypothetical protein